MFKTIKRATSRMTVGALMLAVSAQAMAFDVSVGGQAIDARAKNTLVAILQGPVGFIALLGGVAVVAISMMTDRTEFKKVLQIVGGVVTLMSAATLASGLFNTVV